MRICLKTVQVTMGATQKEEQERVKTLLSDTVALLCKSGLTFSRNLKIQGLLGITLDDDDVFIVHLNEILQGNPADSSTSREITSHTQNSPSIANDSPSTKRKRRRSGEATQSSRDQRREKNYIEIDPDHIEIKSEPEDSFLLDEVKLDNTAGGNSIDQSLNFAISSIKTMTDESAANEGSTASRTPKRRGREGISTSVLDTSMDASPPFVTGLIPNVSDNITDNISNFSFSLDTNIAHPGMSSWTQHTNVPPSATATSLIDSPSRGSRGMVG